METFGMDSYSLEFSSDYATLHVKEISSESEAQCYCLTNEVRIEVSDGDYLIETSDYGESYCQKFEPTIFGTEIVEKPLRFAEGDFIGSADLRDQRTKWAWKDYYYHLAECAITLQYKMESVPTVYVRTECLPENCEGPNTPCRTMESDSKPKE